ncbi:hypothetical protein [Pontiella agarivorans]|uniref:Uncharacterized protein n=1 Tax=Pontiella agarivorans TaxID=3038953 RepID=A0ABU5MY53_9BACT|nr:hypothetical protein [Pontiella agarivorans]MDZ8119099.1 hypothetical protein [Pontiella agarivorans]
MNRAGVHWEPEEYPTADQWSELNDQQDAHPAKIMLREGELLKQTRAPHFIEVPIGRWNYIGRPVCAAWGKLGVAIGVPNTIDAIDLDYF